jgi:phosphatidylserine/phosphatidylglycerophosphate/cardiolipin synthase-like enzyme
MDGADAGRFVYCTPAYREMLPPALKSSYRDLDDLIRRIVLSGRSRLLIVAPYLSSAGMELLRDAITVCASSGSWIHVVTTLRGEAAGPNLNALRSLLGGTGGGVIRSRLRIISSTDRIGALLHAKLVIADGRTGYLGSANLSLRGLQDNLEVGVSLTGAQAGSFDKMIEYLESQGLLEDQTSLLDPPASNCTERS